MSIRKLSKQLGGLRHDGVEAVLSFGQHLSVQVKAYTAAGVSGNKATVTFAELGLPNMVDTNYFVYGISARATALIADVDDMTTAQFSIQCAAFANGDVCRLLIVGRFADQDE